MKLEDLPDLIARLQDFAAKDTRVEKLVNELSTTMADILAALEKSGPSQAKAIGVALKDLNLPAPQVTVQVQPTPVTVHAPAAAAPPAWERLCIETPSGGRYYITKE